VSRAQQNKTARRRLVPAVLGFGLVLAIAGCGAGQVTQTDTQVAGVNGVSGQAGQVGVRDAQLLFPPNAAKYYPKGSDAALLTTIVNDGSSGDRLVSVSSPAASSVSVQGSTVLPASFALTASAPSGQSGPSGSAAPTGSGVPASSGAAAPTSAGAAPGSAGSAPGGGPMAAPGKITLTLVNLTRDVRPGETIPMTFVFANAGQVTLDVPIGAPTQNTQP
jgi:copper(I)-binding protein